MDAGQRGLSHLDRRGVHIPQPPAKGASVPGAQPDDKDTDRGLCALAPGVDRLYPIPPPGKGQGTTAG